MKLLAVTPDVARARAKWQYTGRERPPFAQSPDLGQLSVWDFPRPPRIEPVGRELRVESDGAVIARTTSGRRVLETAGAPTYYFPPEHVDAALVRPTGHAYHCEWKGVSEGVAASGAADAGWILTATYPEFSSLLGWYAFYPARTRCFVDGEPAGAQPGGYYGGWVTRDLAGPIKGAPGSGWW